MIDLPPFLFEDKRHRAESVSEDSRPPSASRGDPKKGKNDGTVTRSSSINLRRTGAGIENTFFH